MERSFSLLSAALRRKRPVGDDEFDLLLPSAAREASANFWTPVAVARRAAELFESHGVEQVLDVGSGAGKFCVVGALSSSVRFTGIEQRLHLVRVAEVLASKLGVARQTAFVHGTMAQIDFARFGGLYFFNPFTESLFAEEDRLDQSIALSEEKWFRDVWLAEQLLAAMPLHSYVATYHGFGGRIPDCYELAEIEAAGSNFLRLWHKVRSHATTLWWLEENGASARDLPSGRLGAHDGDDPPSLLAVVGELMAEMQAQFFVSTYTPAASLETNHKRDALFELAGNEVQVEWADFRRLGEVGR